MSDEYFQEIILKAQTKFKRSISDYELEYLSHFPKDILQPLVQSLEEINDNKSLQGFLFHTTFFISSETAEYLLNDKNHINTFLVRISYEEDEWRVLVTMKSIRSKGQVLHTRYNGTSQNGEPPKLIDSNVVGSIQLIDETWATKMLCFAKNKEGENVFFSLPKALISGK